MCNSEWEIRKLAFSSMRIYYFFFYSEIQQSGYDPRIPEAVGEAGN